jgi:hypothetical protein
MSSHITARASRIVVSTAIAAMCLGGAAVPFLATATAPAAATVALGTPLPQPHPPTTPDGNPWGY